MEVEIREHTGSDGEEDLGTRLFDICRYGDGWSEVVRSGGQCRWLVMIRVDSGQLL